MNIVSEIPNEKLLEAFAEVEDMKKHSDLYKGYTDVKELFKDLELEASDD